MLQTYEGMDTEVRPVNWKALVRKDCTPLEQLLQTTQHIIQHY